MNLDKFQERVYKWMRRCFVRPDAMHCRQRAFRFTEEALELAQASFVTKEEVLRIVDYVYDRPMGTFSQEVGGVMVTLSGLATSCGQSLSECALEEIIRCEGNTEKIRQKDLNKPEFGPLPGEVVA